MCEAIKTFQTLDNNSKILLIILKVERAACFQNIHVYVYERSYCEKGKMKDSKKF